MTTKTLCIVLCSGEHEKIHMSAMLASVAAVSNRKVQLFVSMNAMLAFAKDMGNKPRYHGGTFSQLMIDKKAPDSLALLAQGKALGDMTVHACSMALDLLGWELSHLVPNLFDGELGLTKFLADAEQGELVIV